MVNFSKWMQNDIATVKSGDTPTSATVSKLWTKRISQEYDRPYFENLETGETSWDLPDGAHVMGEDLPKGWEVRYSSEDKRIYYANDDDDKTVWNLSEVERAP